MLDKSIPYKDIVMEITKEDIQKLISHRGDDAMMLPSGYTFCFYSDGMQRDWSRIVTSVLEFDAEVEALDYFERDYVCFPQELQRRCIFVKNPNGLAVATATAWFAPPPKSNNDNNQTSDSYSIGDGDYQPSLHWVAVHPDYQGLGLGKAISHYATTLFATTDRQRNVVLHTQTWSHKAVMMYWKLGYRVSKTKEVILTQEGGKEFKVLKNGYHEGALDILHNILGKDVVQTLYNTAR